MENEKKTLPSVREIVSSLPIRALQLYRPTEENVDEAIRFVREVVAPAGITHITVTLYYGFDYPSHPDIVERNYPYTTVSVAKKFAAACKELGIVVVPEIDVPGHQSLIYRDSLPDPKGMIRVYPDMEEPWGEGHSTRSVCTRHPRLRPILYDMVDDLLEAFDTKVIHTGFDECMDIGKCDRCRGIPEYQLYADLVNDLNRHVRSRGAEMWIWGDRLLDASQIASPNAGYETSFNNTARAVDLISKDIVICDWHYNYQPYGYLSIAYLISKGFKVLPAAFNSLAGVEQLAHAANAMRHTDGMLGTFLTTWSFLDEFMDCVNSKIEPYRKSGVIEQDESDVSSAIHASHRFADQSSDVFLKMYVKPEA